VHLLPNQYIPLGKTEPITYPPLYPPKPEEDITKSFYWDCFTADEQQMLFDFPVEDSSAEIALLRTEVAALGFSVPDGVLEIEPDLLLPCSPIPGWVPPETKDTVSPDTLLDDIQPVS
jgi:hypothetical protein